MIGEEHKIRAGDIEAIYFVVLRRVIEWRRGDVIQRGDCGMRELLKRRI